MIVSFVALSFIAMAQQPAIVSADLDSAFPIETWAAATSNIVHRLKPAGGMGESEASVVRGLDVRGNAFEHIRWEAIRHRSCADCSFVGVVIDGEDKPASDEGLKW